MITVVTSVSVPLRKLRAFAANMSPKHHVRLHELTPHAKQADLADDRLIRLHELNMRRGYNLVVATTMELVILRLQRRVRQGKLKAAHLRVIVLTKDGTAHSCRVDDAGEFLDVWPEGFYDARMAELF